MTATEILAALSEQNIEVWVEGERLRYRAPGGALTPALRALLVEKKTELLDLLRRQGSASRAYPLSYSQRALWFLYRTIPESAAYNVAFAACIRSAVDVSILRGAFQFLVDRHAVLRTTYGMVNGAPVQHPHSRAELCFEEIDAAAWSVEELHARVVRAYRRPFDLEAGPLLRVSLFTRSAEDHVLLVTVHHIAVDGWSLLLLLDELRTLYSAARTGQPARLPAIKLEYTDYVRWQSEALSGAEGDCLWAYWQKNLAGRLPLLNLPTDRPRPSIQTHNGASHPFVLEKNLMGRLEALARAEGATLYMLLLAAFQLLLHRCTGQEDLLVGSPTYGRSRPEFASIVGDFVNMIVLRANPTGALTFKEFLAQARGTVLSAIEHQDYPLALLVERLQPSRDPGRSALFQAVFALQKFERSKASLTDFMVASDCKARLDFAGLKLEPFAMAQQEGQFDLGLEMAEGNGLLVGTFKYNSDLFEAATIRRTADHFRTLLEGIVADPERRLSDLPMLSDGERRQLLIEWNNTKVDYPKDKCIHELFEAQVEKTPDAVAVVFEGEQLTYRELNSRANRLAHYLKKRGVGPDVLVGVCLERSIEMIVAFLGIVKAAGAYIPLDSQYPRERLAFMLKDAAIRVLVGREGSIQSLTTDGIEAVCIDRDWGAIAEESDQSPAANGRPEQLAYVIYTSGSTGTPKGVAVSQQAIVRLVIHTDYVPLRSDDVVAQVSNSSFDAATFEIWGALLNGARLVIITKDVVLAPEQFAGEIKKHGITTLFLTTALFNMMVRQVPRAFSSLRHLLFGGEAVEPRWVAKALQDGPPERLLHVYGPTETTTFATWQLVKNVSDDATTVPIGRPIANTTCYVLDARGKPVPIGVAGELYIGGEGLARGYLNRPELTAEKFITDPFSDEPGARLYRTGDLGRWLSDGTIEFLGRVDRQIKIRGFRLELGEIEATLVSRQHVREAVVTVREDVPEEKRLVAYVVAARQPAPTSGELRSFLQQKLPDYMIPSTFVQLNSLPLTPNGKVDMRALPVPDNTRPELEGFFVAPRTEVEGTIASVWRDVLHLEKVGIDDNFFDLGGHSLLLLQVHTKLRQIIGGEIAVTKLFEYPTIRALAAFLSRSDEGTPAREQSRVEPSGGRSRQNSQRGRPIAIVGMAGRFPGAANLDEFWENLRAGVESIKHFSAEEVQSSGINAAILQDPVFVGAGGVLENIDRFDASFFGINPKEAEIINPQQRLLLECAWEALESGGFEAERYPGRIGVYAGAGMNNYAQNLQSADERDSAAAYQKMIGNSNDQLTTRVSYKLNLKGPSVDVQTACSTSLVAIHLACQALLGGECDLALAGGVSLRVPRRFGYFYQEGMILSPDGHCRAFDAKAKGTVGSEGLGIVVLKRLEDALADGDTIHAVIKGSAINNDGSFKVGYTAPSVGGQAEVIQDAQRKAEVEPETISYIEAHGTGTELGDPIEIAALTKAFRAGTEKKNFCAIGSLKTNIGHTDAAAGVAGLIKTLLALKHREIPPSLNFEDPNPAIDFANSPFFVNTKLARWETNGIPRRAGVSSFGIGGTNAHMIVEEAPELEDTSESRPLQLLLLSARTDTALDTMSAALAKYLRKHSDLKLADVAHTLQIGRKALGRRRMVVCRDVEDAATALETLDPKRIFSAAEDRQERPVAFMFTGQGSQYVGMANELYESEPTFKEHIDTSAELLTLHLGLDVREVLYPSETQTQAAAEKLDQTHITQPAIFVIEYALAKLWMEWGVKPQAMIGHSIGEYVAACLAGVFSVEDALALVVARGRLMQSMPRGSMLSVGLSEEEVGSLLGTELSLAAVNGLGACVVAGPTGAVERLEQRLTEQGVAVQRLHTSHAFHSTMMDAALESFRHEVGKIKLHRPAIRYVSNVTGTWITESEATDPSYWARHLRETVRFGEGVRELVKEQNLVLLEVGPAQTLTSLARRNLERAADRIVLPSLPQPQSRQSAVALILETLGRLWIAGVPVDWAGFYIHERRRRIPLPTYPFERQRYWVEAKREPSAAGTRPGSIEKKPDIADWFYVPSWKRSIPPQALDRSASASPETWLVFTDECGLGTEVVKRLEQEGQHIIPVRLGEHFEGRKSGYCINPRSVDDYIALVKDLDAQGRKLYKVLHLWSLASNDAADIRLQQSDEYQDRGLFSLLFLAQALSIQHITDPIEVIVVSNHIQQVTGDEIICPEKATILGACKVIPLEYKNLICRSIDIVIPQSMCRADSEIIEALVAEFRATSSDHVIAYRGMSRWVESFEPVRLQKPTGRGSRLREKGVYLITGGLGGVGLTLAEYLAKTVRAKLILTGRSFFPIKEEWVSWMRNHDELDPISGKIRRLQSLEALGAEVLVCSADIASEEAMRQVIAEGKHRFGQIHGVVCCAGVADYAGVIDRRSREATESVMASKLKGTLVLNDLLKDTSLDFMALSSSMSSVLYRVKFGEVGYCAANEFIDAFTCYKKSLREKTFTVAINWYDWKEVGMAVESVKRRARRQGIAEERVLADENSQLLRGMSPSEGAEVFSRILESPLCRVLVSTQDLTNVLETVAESTRSPDFKSFPGGIVPDSRHPRPTLPNTYVAPDGLAQRQLTEIWEELLGVSPIGIHDNFFELGGHSLVATQVISRVRSAFKIDIPLRSVFEAPTIAELAASIAAALRAGHGLPTWPVIERVPRDRNVPTSFSQQRLWFLDQLEPGNPSFNIPAAVRLTGALDIVALEQSVNEIVRRHEALRTTFAAVDGQPIQMIVPNLTIPMRVVDLQAIVATERNAQAHQLMRDEASYSFDLAKEPLLRSMLLRVAPQEHILLLNMHHIVSDAWSVRVFFAELSILYEAFSSGKPSPLPDLRLQYADFAVWQRRWMQDEVLAAQIAYWKRQLDGAPPVLELPTDYPRPRVQTYRGAVESMVVSNDLYHKLKALSQREAASLYMVLLAAFMLLLHRYSGQNDIVVGTPIAGRSHRDLESLIGFLLNTLALRTDLSGNPSFRELIARVREVALGAFAHQDLPFEKLLEELKPERDLSRTPLFQVFFNMITGEDRLNLRGLTAQSFVPGEALSKFDLTLYAREQGEQIQFALVYNADIFEPARMSEMLRQFDRILSQIVENPDEKIGHFSLVTESAKKYLPNPIEILDSDWKGAVHAQFSVQAEKFPQRLAVLDKSETWTYKELDCRSNQLANYLRDNGIANQDIVAIYGHRSAPLVLAVLGILKAGAAYLILDPAYPPSRLIYCLETAKPRAWLHIEAAGTIPSSLDHFLRTLHCRLELSKQSVADSRDPLSEFPTTHPEIVVGPESPACVSFTSGSTGRPNAILGKHGSLSHFLPWQEETFQLGPSDRFSMLSGLAHDPLQRDMFTPLWLGAAICIPDPEIIGSPELAAWMAKEQITVAHLTPAMAELLTETAAPDDRIPSLRYVSFLGDRLTRDCVAKLRRLAPQATCINSYGSTETQRAVGCYVLPQENHAQNSRHHLIYPLGCGMKDVQFLILSADGRLAGVGEAGEIYVRSPHLALGYLGDDALTRARFLTNPFTGEVDDRLYKTGDIARYRPDGNVEFVGRADRQVKLRGFRIELEEIEVVLERHALIQRAIVVIREHSRDTQHLVAYLVPAAGQAPSVEMLRNFVRSELPEYMVPSAFVLLEALPLTPNGKVDYGSLPVFAEDGLTAKETLISPRTELEDVLAGILAAVLKVDQMSIHDNFFHLGGHSLLATQAISRICNALQVKMTLRDFFENPTPAGLAERIEVIRWAIQNPRSDLSAIDRTEIEL